MAPERPLQTKTVLITGGAGGIGAALATSLAHQGARVILGDVANAAPLVAQLRTTTGNAEIHALTLDVTDFGSQQRFFREAAALCGGDINTVVVNAGINAVNEQMQYLDPAVDYTAGPMDREAPVMRTVDVNLVGAMWTTQLAIAYMTRKGLGRGDRHILFVASIAGLFGVPLSPYYAVAKHGMVGLFRALRFGSINPGYRVNCLCPYFIDTPILGLGGKIFLYNAVMTKMEDVVNTAVQTIASPSEAGRLLAIVPRVTAAQAREVGLSVPNDIADGEERAVWDVEDLRGLSGDEFTRRIVMLMNLAAAQKSAVAKVRDLGAALWEAALWVVGLGPRR